MASITISSEGPASTDSYEVWQLDDICEALEESRMPGSPRPPVPYSVTKSRVKAWKKRVYKTLNDRIAQFADPSSPVRVSGSHKLLTTPSSKADQGQQTGFQAHRALHVPELLDSILRLLSPVDQFEAWYVSRQWRAVIDNIMAQQFRQPAPCAAVEYGDWINADSLTVRLTPEELSNFQHRILCMADRLNLRGRMYGNKQRYYPAYLSQAQGLPRPISEAFRNCHSDRWGPFHISTFSDKSLCADKPQWLDFSQMRLNPYFSKLFGDPFADKLGRYDITLNPGSDDDESLLDRSLPRILLSVSLGSMFVTKPPCKSIGIYTVRNGMQLLEQVYNNAGIRIGQLVKALQQCTQELCMLWRKRMDTMQRELKTKAWAEYRGRTKHEIWIVTAALRFTLLLDNERMPVDASGFDVAKGHYT